MVRDILRLDIRLLTAFEVLVTERNVTRAAQRMGVTQQGMSGQLSRMRALFDDPLFVRVKGGVEPTPRAIALEPGIRAALAGLEALVSPERFDPASLDATASIAATDYAQALILPALLASVAEEAPGLRMMIRPVDRESMAADLREARLDLAISVPQFVSGGLRSQHLFDDRYVGVARAGHPILADAAVALEAFCSWPHLLVSPYRGDASGPTDEALTANGRRRRIALVVPGFAVAGALLERTDLIAALPERLIATLRGGLRTFELPVPVDGFRLTTFWPERVHESPFNRWLRDHVARAAQLANAGGGKAAGAQGDAARGPAPSATGNRPARAR